MFYRQLFDAYYLLTTCDGSFVELPFLRSQLDELHLASQFKIRTSNRLKICWFESPVSCFHIFHSIPNQLKPATGRKLKSISSGTFSRYNKNCSWKLLTKDEKEALRYLDVGRRKNGETYCSKREIVSDERRSVYFACIYRWFNVTKANIDAEFVKRLNLLSKSTISI